MTSDLNAIVNTYMTNDQIPGVMVGVWQGDTQLAFVADGYSDLSTMTPISRDDEFKIGSITKSFTVTRILQLAAEGAINLDDPISEYVPGVQNGTATLRELANMTSGIYDYSGAPTFQAALGQDPVPTFTDSQLVAYANTGTPHYAPGTGPWNYSNTNTVLLGMVIAAVTGQTAQQQITDNIISTLGMTHTIYPDPSTTTPSSPFLHGYNASGPDQAASDVSSALNASVFSAAGAIYSTIDDLHVYGEALGKGTLVNSDMQNQRLQFVPAGSVSAGPYYDAYGLGIGSIDGWIGHSGDQPGYQDIVMYNAATDETFVAVINLGVNTTNIPTEMFLDMQSALAVPEPSTWALVSVEMGLLVLAVRKKALLK
jgi:D-alanyl-D-alanine carboxypeptidase